MRRFVILSLLLGLTAVSAQGAEPIAIVPASGPLPEIEVITPIRDERLSRQ